MNGYLDYLPFMADCERGLEQPKKAIDIALSDDAKHLTGEPKAEMFLVYAGALADLGMWDQAIEVVSKLVHAKGLAGSTACAPHRPSSTSSSSPAVPTGRGDG